MPNEARILDYLMGGKDNFAVDREVAAGMLKIGPELPMMMRESRRFLARAAGELVRLGVRQFVDLGCGLPTQGSLHQIVLPAAPEATVVYVDHDPVVIAHGQALVHEPGVRFVPADARDPDALLDALAADGTIDRSRPLGLVLHNLLSAITDDEVAAHIARRVTARMLPGDLLLLTHLVGGSEQERVGELARFVQDSKMIEGDRGLRTPAEVAAYFTGLDLLPPGLVPLTAWYPEPGAPAPEPRPYWSIGALARKP